VQLRLLPYLHHTLLHNTTVNFHTGSTQTMAKILLLEKQELKAGETTWAQLSLSKPVALVKNDHFIVRSSEETLGGGEVIESHARRYRRFRPALIENLKVIAQGTTEQLIMAMLEKQQPLELTTLSAQCDLPVNGVKPAIDSLIHQGRVIRIGKEENPLLLTPPGWEHLAQKVSGILQAYHQKFPSRSGMPKVELSSRMKMGIHSSAILRKLIDEGVAIENGANIRLFSHRVQLTPAQQAKIDNFLKSLSQSPYSPPSNLVPEPDLLNLLIEQQQVVKVSSDTVFSTSAYSEMVEKITSHLKANGSVTLGEVRDMFSTSRKYALALLEHLDGAKITRRVGDERVLY